MILLAVIRLLYFVIIPLLSLIFMGLAVVKSQQKLRTFLKGVLSAVIVLGVWLALILVFAADRAIMLPVTHVLLFVIPAYVMWTHAKSTAPQTLALAPEPSNAQAAGIDSASYSQSH